ncbi:MAG: methyltransferase domain-containing protein [Candidatus Daviesbacteria bacterium]
MKFIVYTTKGLELISGSEIKSKIIDTQIIEVADKRIIFKSDTNFKDLISLRTVDDLGVLILTLENTDNINNLVSEINRLNLNDIKKELEKFRKLSTNNFSITTSLVGVKSFSTDDLILLLSQNIKEKYGWNFTKVDHTNFDIRVFIDHQMGCVSIRLTQESLQHRTYKGSPKLGSLKPTIAATMIYLTTGGNKNLKIIDNFCGSGTILAEGLLMGNKVFGGDIDPESVNITRENLSNLGYKIEDNIKHLNALSTNWPEHGFDCAISNLPWGKQVEIKSITLLYEGSIHEYFRLLKPDGVLCALVSKPDLFIKYIKRYKSNPKIQTFKIGLLGQNPTIILAK